MDDSDALRELSRRLDHIEFYLGRLAAVTGFPYPRYTGTGYGSFDSAPASFGPQPGDRSPGLPSTVPGVNSAVPVEIVMLARSGKVIQAIKQYRELTGLGLKEAKLEVEAAMRQP